MSYGKPTVVEASVRIFPTTISPSSNPVLAGSSIPVLTGPSNPVFTGPSSIIPIPFVYAQIYDSSSFAYLSEDKLANASFRELCPSGNCINDCENLTRLFQAVPDGISISAQDYGRPRPNGPPDATFFGVCSNLGNLTSAANNEQETPLSAVKPFFADPSGRSKIDDGASKIATCFADTCDKTRDPNTCIPMCAREKLLSNVTTLNIEKGIFNCLQVLCDNTCGLPYANQDVFGIGVLVSYAIQACLASLFALVLNFIGLLQLCGLCSDLKPSISHKIKKTLESFLVAQCYFGISTSIAGFFLDPQGIDPLNGYALFSVAIIAFIPTTFTLMLLHSHGFTSWYRTSLTFVTWLISSVLLFLLLNRLYATKDNTQIFHEGLQHLFQISSCGGSSAMALCQQAHGIDPLKSLWLFYNQEGGLNVKSVVLVWAWDSFILAILMSVQIYFSTKKTFRNFSSSLKKSKRLLSTLVHCLTSIIFVLALIHQAMMITLYFQMDVIDKDGWTFGQVVAVLLWVPLVFDCICLFCGPYIKKRIPQCINHVLPSKNHTASHFFEAKGLSLTMSSDYRPLGTSINANWPSPGHDSPSEPLHDSVNKRPLSEDIELREGWTKKTIRTKEV